MITFGDRSISYNLYHEVIYAVRRAEQRVCRKGGGAFWAEQPTPLAVLKPFFGDPHLEIELEISRKYRKYFDHVLKQIP